MMPQRLVLVLLAAGLTGGTGTTHAQHPLDPLSAEEIRLATRLMRADHRLAEAAFTLITVAEPAKRDVLAWRPGRPVGRRARVVASTAEGVAEVEVDLTTRRIASFIPREGVQGALTLSEFLEGGQIALRHPEMVAGLARRGVTDLEKVLCAPLSAGWFDLPEYQGRRLIKAVCLDLRRSTNSIHAWPIEGLSALIDLRTREVVRVVDEGVVPVQTGDHNFDGAASLRNRPDTTRVRLSGNEVSWGNWRFHVRLDGRLGTARPPPDSSPRC
jgi:primary-amine oxidase